MKRGVTYAELEAATTFTVKKNLKNNNGTNSSSSTSRDLSKIGGVDIMQNQFYLQRAKQELFLKLSGKSKSSSLGYLSRVGVDIRSRLDMAFTQCMSTSLLVVGPTGSGKKSIIDHVLRSYQNSDGITPFAVARVQAQVCPTDQDALCSIAGQLCVRNSAGRNVVAALEDLEDHFRQCAMNSQPSVVVLEDVHNFATREKQVLIYTLLDYMHKPDMLFVVIGCTPCAHLQ